MCRRSRHSSKIIVLSLLLFLLLASPCYSAGKWYAFSSLMEKPSDLQNQPLEISSQQEEKTAQEKVAEEAPAMIMEESYPTESMTLLETQRQESLKELEKLLDEFEKESMNYETQSESLMQSAEKLDALLLSLENLDAISEAEYDATKTTLVEALEANRLQADKIARLESEAKTKAYAKLHGIIGFDSGLPTWGLGGALGVRIGHNVMLECGLDYMLGNFTSIPDLSWDIDNLRVTAGIGWMF